jgi:hypothetical protein
MLPKPLLVLLLFCTCITPLFTQTIVFTEDFDGGIPADWTINPISAGDPDSTQNAVWTWTTNAGQPDDEWWLEDFHLQSPTADNGFAIFNAIYLSTNGSTAYQDIDSGPISYPVTSELITPVIDCSDLSSVVLTFHQQFYKILSVSRIGISIDGGDTWEYEVINGGVTFLGGTIADYKMATSIDFTDIAAGEPNVQFSFHYDGRSYFWAVDDVIVSGEPEFDLVLDHVVYPLQSYAQPLSQLIDDELEFSLTVSNRGSENLFNVVKKVEVRADNGTLLFADSIETDFFPVGFVDVEYNFQNTYVVQNIDTGLFHIEYSVYSLDHPDFTPSNNVAHLPFQATETSYAKSYGPHYGAVTWTGGDGSFRAGNLYHTSAVWNNGFIAEKARVRICCQPELGGKTIPIKLYEVKPDIAENWNDFDVDSDNSLMLRGIGEYEFTDEDFIDWVDIILVDANTLTPGVSLNPGSRYFLVVEFFGENAPLAIQLNNKIEYESESNSTVFWNGVWNVIGTGIFGPPFFVPEVRMEIAMDVTNTQENTLPENTLQINPNPAIDFINIQVDLPQTSDYQLTLAGMTGQILKMRTYNSKQERLTWSVEDLPPGAYWLRLSTEAGMITRRWVKVNP